MARASRKSTTRGPFVLEVVLRRDIVPSFDDYPFALPVVRALHTLPLHAKVTFFSHRATMLRELLTDD